MDILYAKICMRFFILCAYVYVLYRLYLYVQICMCPAIIWVCCMRLFVCASCMCPGMCCTVFVCVSEKVGCFYYYQIVLRPSLSLSALGTYHPALGTYHRAYSCHKGVPNHVLIWVLPLYCWRYLS